MNLHIDVLALAVLAQVHGAAEQAPAPLTINQAVQQAVEKYPAVRASLERVQSASAAVDLARTAYLPRADLLAQLNRATRNNVFGLVLPQSVLPSMSGPVLGTNDLTSVWGSAVGVLFSWEPFDFGLRRAHMESAESAGKRAEAGVNVTRLEVAAGAADACLTLLAAQQTVVAARAGVDRATVLAQVVEGLAKAGLRPGADAARTRAELARARTQVIQAEQSVAGARASLAQFLALLGTQITP